MKLSRRGARAFALTKSGTLQVNPADLENAAASALAGAPEGTVFVTFHGERGLEHLVVTDDQPGVEGVAFSFARAMAARSVPVEEVPDMVSVPAVAELVIRRGTAPFADTQTGADFGALSRLIGDMLMPGEWVAIVTRRSASRSESKWQARWLDFHGLRTHHSRKSGAVVMSLWAGGRNRQRASDIAVRTAAGIPGFGLGVKARLVSSTRTAAIVGASGALITGVGVSAGLFGWFPAAGVAVTAVITAGVVVLLGAALTWRGVIPSRAVRVRRLLAWGRLPEPGRRRVPPRKPRQERIRPDKDGVPVTVSAFGGDYPLADGAFLVGPHVPLSIVAPHAGAASGGSFTGQRAAPPQLRSQVGPSIGVNEGAATFLSVADFWSGIGVVGQAGSGKTAYLEHLWGFASKQRMTPLPIPGNPSRHALVAFDTKGDGLAAAQYEAWSRAVGDRPMVVHTSDVDGELGIELFPDLGDGLESWARRVVDAMVYVWGVESIGARSFDTLSRVLMAAKVIDGVIASRVTGMHLRLDGSPFYYANVLLGNNGDDLAVELAGAIANAAVQPGASGDLVEAGAKLAPLFGANVTRAQRTNLLDAPRTKVAALMAAEHWWSRTRRTTWATLLERDWPVIINTGASPNGRLPDEKLRTDLSGLMLYTLHEEIKRTCRGWYEKNRAVSIFADEVKHIAASSADVITWMRNDARANGVRPVFATQTPDTLATEVRRSMLGFGTLVLFAQNDSTTVRELVADLSLAGGVWDTSDLTNLDRYEAIVRATHEQKRLEPFTVSIPNFRAMRDAGTWNG